MKKNSRKCIDTVWFYVYKTSVCTWTHTSGNKRTGNVSYKSGSIQARGWWKGSVKRDIRVNFPSLYFSLILSTLGKHFCFFFNSLFCLSALFILSSSPAIWAFNCSSLASNSKFPVPPSPPLKKKNSVKPSFCLMDMASLLIIGEHSFSPLKILPLLY